MFWVHSKNFDTRAKPTKVTIFIVSPIVHSIARVILKWNSLLAVSTENVKIEYFLKKIFNSHIYVLVDNDTVKILNEIEFVNSHILENIVK